MTEIEKALQAALDKALSDSASGVNEVIKSFNALTARVKTLQQQVDSLNATQQAAAAREQALMRLCNDLAGQLETLSTKLNTIKR
jgi:hypothetical protein